MERPYSRAEINKTFVKTKGILHQEALVRGNGRALYLDSYTGKTLLGGDPYDYDHVFSSESLYMRLSYLLTDEEIAEIVNCRENIAVTLRSINQSKGKKDPELWIRESQLMDLHEIDLELTKSVILRAKIKINALVAEFIKKKSRSKG